MWFFIHRESISSQDARSVHDIILSVFETSFGKKLQPHECESDSGLIKGIIVGFNNTARALEQQAKTTRSKIYASGSASYSAEGSDADPVVLVLVCKHDIASELACAHLPALCATAGVLRLVALPKGSANALSQSMSKNSDLTQFSSEKNTQKRKVDELSSESDKQKGRLEVTVISIRKSATATFAMIGNLMQMLEDKDIGKVKIPEIVKQIMQRREEFYTTTDRRIGKFYKPSNIISLKTTAPLASKKQTQVKKSDKREDSNKANHPDSEKKINQQGVLQPPLKKSRHS